MKDCQAISELVSALDWAGVEVRLDGADLVLRAKQEPPADLLDAVRKHKAAIVAWLQQPHEANERNGGKSALDASGQARAEGLQPDPQPPPQPGPSASESHADGLPPPLGDRTTALLDALFAAGCRPDALPDGQTFAADCPRCRRRGAVRIVETGSIPAVQLLCGCDAEVVPLRELGSRGQRAGSLAVTRRPLSDAVGDWPPWAVNYHARLVRAGCDPRIVATRGAGGRPILAVEATCPACRRPDALAAWPWSTGMMFSRCANGGGRRQIADALALRWLSLEAITAVGCRPPLKTYLTPPAPQNSPVVGEVAKKRTRRKRSAARQRASTTQ